MPLEPVDVTLGYSLPHSCTLAVAQPNYSIVQNDYYLKKGNDVIWRVSPDAFSAWEYTRSKRQSKHNALVRIFYAVRTKIETPLTYKLKLILLVSFVICTHPQIPLGRSSQGEWGGQGMWHAWERREKCTRFWWESPKERYYSEDQDVDRRMGLESILGTLVGGCGLGSIGLGIGSGGELLWVL
jgi:hypothetical protein